MKQFYEFSTISGLLQSARFLVLLLIIFILSAFNSTGTVFAQSTAEVCRETQKIIDQYERELGEIELTGTVLELRSYLSELRKAIANGFVAPNLTYIAGFLRLELPGPTAKERLAFQKTVRTVLERELQKAIVADTDDLELQKDRIRAQLRLRYQRMEDLDCSKAIDIEKSSKSDIFGTWSGTYRNSKGDSGTAYLTFSEGANGKITGNEDGVPILDITVSGNVVTFKYKLSGCRRVEGTLTVNPDGKTASGSYTITECNGTDKYTGNYIDYRK